MAYPKFKVTFELEDYEAEDGDNPENHIKAVKELVKELSGIYAVGIEKIEVEIIK